MRGATTATVTCWMEGESAARTGAGVATLAWLPHERIESWPSPSARALLHAGQGHFLRTPCSPPSQQQWRTVEASASEGATICTVITNASKTARQRMHPA
jgi:hypothetical protein